MSIAIITLLLFSALVGALVVGVPIAFATGAVAVVFGVWLFDFNTLNLVVSRVFTLMGNQILVSVPLFILMATILEKAGIAEDIFKAAYIWSGKLRGGLAVAVVMSVALMAALVFLELNGVTVVDPTGRLQGAMIDLSARRLDKAGLAALLGQLAAG